MSEDEGFRRYLQSGMAWFSVTQQKAEGILRELADSGETAMGQAQKAFERMVERSRQGSEELRDLVRSEIREQVAALGLATKDDISRLEAKIEDAQAQAPPKRGAPKPGASKSPGARAAAPPGSSPPEKA
jgi:polyhydroxyalkanoate synthesis regulator phasin